MRLATTLLIRVKNGFLPHLTNEIYKRNCAIRNISLLESESDDVLKSDLFRIEIIYQSADKYNGFLNKISKHEDNFQVISSVNIFENKLEGGLLNVTGKMHIENIVDYELNVLGATDFILDALDMESDRHRYTGLSNNVGLFYALPDEDELKKEYYKYYTLLERDSVIINRFAGMNAYPLLAKVSQIDDLLKIIQKLQFTFSAIRIFNLQDVDDISSFERLYSEVSMPLLSQYYDEIPLYLLTAINHILKRNDVSLNTCTVGFIGIDISSIRIARLLMKLGVARVLGSDSSMKLMHCFEKEGGLATSMENIYSSSDLLIFFKDKYDEDDLKNISSGQLVISMLEKEMDAPLLRERGVRDFLQSRWMDFSSLFPGILKGLINAEFTYLNDDKLIRLSNRISELKSGNDFLPDVFSELHQKIPELISELS